jgi:hypothetical protein
MKVLRKQEIDTANIQVGDQMVIPLAELGAFTVTAHKVTDEGVMFIFDDYVTRRPMNNRNTNKGGFEKSDLKKWMDTVLYMAFPEELRDKIYGLTLPTVGQIVGHEDEWDNKNLEPDTNEQLPLMKKCKNRIACFEDQLAWGWLRNATKEEFSSANFAIVNAGGSAHCNVASGSYGVRPEFWLVKQESRGPVPRSSDRYPWGSNNKEFLTDRIREKENEIKDLKRKVKDLEEKEMFAKAASEMKNLRNRFVEAGFTEDEAFHMVLELSKMALGIGGRK